MTIYLARGMKDRIKSLGLQLVHKPEITVRYLAGFTCNLVTAGLAMPWTPLKYKYFEILRNEALGKNCGDSDTLLVLDEEAKHLVTCWTNNIHSCIKSLDSVHHIQIYSPPQMLSCVIGALHRWQHYRRSLG